MITFSTFKEAILQAGRRILKVEQYDVKTADQVSSFGDDSSPLPNMTAIYAKTSNISDNIIIGYINTNQISEMGEKRLFSLRNNGELSFSLHLKNDGTCEIGGDADFMVRYNALNTQLQSQVTSINAELVKIQTGIIAAGGTYTPQNISLDLSSAKIENIKTP